MKQQITTPDQEKVIVWKHSNPLEITIIENPNTTLSLTNYKGDYNNDIISQVKTYIDIINALVYKKCSAENRRETTDEKIISENIDVLIMYMKDLIHTPEEDKKVNDLSGISLYAMESDT